MCFDYEEDRLSVTVNGSQLVKPVGFEVTTLSDRNRVFILPIKSFTKRFIRNQKLKGLKR